MRWMAGQSSVVIPHEDEDDAVRIANGIDFGLVSSGSTSDLARAMRVSYRIEAGAVFVSNSDRALAGSPLGRTKRIGYGRERTPETLDEHGHTTILRLPTRLWPLPRWPTAAEVLPPSRPLRTVPSGTSRTSDPIPIWRTH